MTTPRDGFVTVNGLRLHYLEWGDAGSPPMLLLHGGSAHAHWWDFFAVHMSDRYRLLALDLRGHGESEWATSDYSLEIHASDVRAFAEAFALRQLILIGHSFGGFVAMEVARDAREDLAALIVIDSRARISQRNTRYMEALRKLPHPVYASPEEAIRRFRLLPTPTSARREVIAHVARHGIRQIDGGSWTLRFDRRAIANTSPRDMSSALATIRCPVLVVRGANSHFLPAVELAEFAAAAPHAQAAEIADAHHHVMLDQPAALANAVSTFLGNEK